MKREVEFILMSSKEGRKIYGVLSNFIDDKIQTPIYVGKIYINDNVNRYAFHPVITLDYGEYILTKVVKFLKNLNKEEKRKNECSSSVKR